MDRNSNVNLQVVQGDMDQKLENTHGQITLGHFEITFLKYNGKSIFWFFQILIETLQIFF